MPIEIFTDLPQGSDEWKRARAGIPTASEFSSILAKGEGKTRRAYMLRLAGEVVTGEPEETFKSADMVRGNVMEDDARRAYAFMSDRKPERVGFVKQYGAGCSPDSLIGSDGGLEIKTAKPSVLIEILERDAVPTSHIPQVQGSMWVTDRDWWDVTIFWPKMPQFIKRVHRDIAKIAEIRREVAIFNEELAALADKIKRYGVAA